MSRARKLLIIASAFVVAVVIVLAIAGPSMQRSFFYPKPHDLPPVVGQTTEQLLTRLQSVLEANAPIVAQSLLPGLPDAQISALEAQGGFHLSDDLKAIYRWRNGMPTNSIVGLLPGQRFRPLDEFVHEQILMRQQMESAPVSRRVAFEILAGHRKGWVQVLDDGAGDGYFYDPKRTDAEGAFFEHMAEEAYYLWFPSIRNFLSGTIECYETKAIKVATNHSSLEEDFEQTQKIWVKLAKSSEIAK